MFVILKNCESQSWRMKLSLSGVDGEFLAFGVIPRLNGAFSITPRKSKRQFATLITLQFDYFRR